MTEHALTDATMTEAMARERLVKRSDMVACKVAFVDCKMPGSTDKENYSLIDAGVTRSADQVVNLVEPHGFSLGVAAMAPGTVNNPARPLHSRSVHDLQGRVDLSAGGRTARMARSPAAPATW